MLSLGVILSAFLGVHWGRFSGLLWVPLWSLRGGLLEAYFGGVLWGHTWVSYLVEFYILINISFVPITKKNNLLEFCRHSWIGMFQSASLIKLDFNWSGSLGYASIVIGWMGDCVHLIGQIFYSIFQLTLHMEPFCKGSIQYFFMVSSVHFPESFLRLYNSPFVLGV